MVLGLRMCVIHVPSVIQCAETHRTALGRGSRFPSSPSVRVKGVSRRAFIGLPWPIKRTGIFSAELLTPDPINCDLSPTPPMRAPDASIMRQPCTPGSRELGFRVFRVSPFINEAGAKIIPTPGDADQGSRG